MMYRSEKKRVIVVLFCVVLFSVFPTSLMAQSYLGRPVSVKDIHAQPLGKILKQTEKNNGFYFSYQSHSVSSDSLVSMPEFQGTLLNFLEKLMGPDYDFKEMPGYVIIRYVPKSLDITLNDEQGTARRLVLTGCVRDLENGNGIEQASVYERKVLVSTLTDGEGNFELKIKHPDKSIYITVNKNNYRDTTIVFLLPIEIYRKDREDKFFYYPDDKESEEGVERSVFARFFISSKQMIQRINLGGFFAHSPYQVSLIPGLSSHGMFSSQVVNNASLNVIGGYTAGVNGVELAGCFNINQKNVKKLQMAGIFNIVGNNVSGLQVAGVSNTVMGNTSGAQLAGVWNSAKKTTGAQLSGVVNESKELDGLQIAGVMNHSSGITGSQISGVINAGGQVKGIQLGGVCNTSKEISGVQIAGVMNHSSGKTGSQFSGVFNIAGKVKGIQAACLLNIADSCDYPIGLINIIKKGRKSFSVESCESGVTSIVFRSGGRVLYSLLGMGYNIDDQVTPYAYDVGFGVHVLNTKSFSFDIEQAYRQNTDLKKKDQSLNSLRFLSGLRLGHHVGLFAGPSVNFVFDSKWTDEFPGWVLNKEKGNALYIGCTYGVSFIW